MVTRQLATKVTPEFYEAVEEAAKLEERTTSSFVRASVKERVQRVQQAYRESVSNGRRW